MSEGQAIDSKIKDASKDSIILAEDDQFVQPKCRTRVKKNSMIGIQNIIDEGPKLWKALLAELIGTLIYIFVGCGSYTKWDPKSPPIVLHTAFAFGMTRIVITNAIGHISGAHINPSVTVAFVTVGYFRPLKGLLYIIFQCVGAVMGALLLAMVTPKEFQGRLGCTVPNEHIHPLQAVAIEAVISCLFCLVDLNIVNQVLNDATGTGRLELGFVIIACQLFANKYTGCSMNPARSLGPAVVVNIWKHFWIYLVGPCVGAVFAAIIYRSSFYVRKPGKDSVHGDHSKRPDEIPNPRIRLSIEEI